MNFIDLYLFNMIAETNNQTKILDLAKKMLSKKGKKTMN